jgi:hypothetical protein
MTDFGTGKLTKLDERVLAALPPGKARRVSNIMAALERYEYRYGIWPRTREEDVRLILRGFEHLGRATGRGGWWRAL